MASGTIAQRMTRDSHRRIKVLATKDYRTVRDEIELAILYWEEHKTPDIVVRLAMQQANAKKQLRV